MRRFNLPGVHNVDVATKLHLDTEKEPTISVSSEKVIFVETSNVVEETDAEKEYNLLHISGIKHMSFKGGNTMNFSDVLHVNTDEDSDAGYDNEVITIGNKNSMEEVDSTNHINVLHMNSIKDLFFRVKNNAVFNEFKKMYTTGIIYNITGRESYGVDLSVNGEGASASGSVLTLKLIDENTSYPNPTVTLQYEGHDISQDYYYYQNRGTGENYDFPVAMTVPDGVTVSNVRVYYNGLVAGWASAARNINWIQSGNRVIIYGYEYWDYEEETGDYVYTSVANKFEKRWTIAAYD